MMSCEQQKKCYVYFFGELSGAEKRAFKNHVKECKLCRLELNRVKNVWKNIKEMPLEQPSSKVAQTIRQRARQAGEKKKFFAGITEWFAFLWMDYQKPVSIAAAVSVLVLVVILSPIRKIMFSDYRETLATDWDDNFIAQVDNLEYTLDWIESSDLSSELESIGEYEQIWEDNDVSSSFRKELDFIEESLEYLNEI